MIMPKPPSPAIASAFCLSIISSFFSGSLSSTSSSAICGFVLFSKRIA